MPGLVGVEHLAFTVPDLDRAEAFFTGVLGACVVRRASYGDPAGDEALGRRLGTDASTTSRLVKVDLAGVPVELWAFAGPDVSTTVARNCDAGGHHLGLVVEDVDAAASALAAVDGVTVLDGPNDMTDEHGRHRRWVYALTP
ncbi:MAG: VOC family protein [Actinomycetota bacterium]|nr:VOC family protein [Actinomycetota bacterium]